jgi:predicted nuclease of predicted toxin-antitoxin system
MRIRVKDVLDMLADGAKPEEILTDFPDLEPEDIQACIAYAARYVDHSVLVTDWEREQLSIFRRRPPQTRRPRKEERRLPEQFLLGLWVMRFLVDAQLPPALARWLGEHGQTATAVREAGLRDSDDGSIWNFATTGAWTLITKDEDFVSRCLSRPDAPAVVWLRIGNCTNRVLFAWLEPLLPAILNRLDAGDRLVEVRRKRS